MGTGLFGGIAFGQYTESFSVSPFKAGVYGSPIARANMIAVPGVSVASSQRAMTTARTVQIQVEIISACSRKILR